MSQYFAGGAARFTARNCNGDPAKCERRDRRKRQGERPHGEQTPRETATDTSATAFEAHNLKHSRKGTEAAKAAEASQLCFRDCCPHSQNSTHAVNMAEDLTKCLPVELLFKIVECLAYGAAYGEVHCTSILSFMGVSRTGTTRGCRFCGAT